MNFNTDSTGISEALKLRGFLVRPGWVFGTPNHMRVSFSTMDINKRFIEALEDVLEETALERATKEKVQFDDDGLPITPPPGYPHDHTTTLPPGEPNP